MFTCRKRKKFREGREPLPDTEFLRVIGVTTGKAARYALAVRRAMGRICKVLPETIRESDGVRELCDLIFDGWDQLGFVLELECQLDRPLSTEEVPHPTFGWKFFFWGQDKDEAFGEFARRVAEYLDQKLTEFGVENQSPDNSRH